MKKRRSCPAAASGSMSLLAALALTACGGDGSGKNHSEVTGTGGSGGGSPDWPMLGYNGQSTYNNTGETKISRETVKNLTVAWTKDLGNNLNGAPIMAAGRVFISNYNTNYCFDVATGQEVWSNGDFLDTATFAYSEGVLYAHDFGGVLIAMDAETGKTKWSLPTPAPDSAIGFSSPMIGGDLVIIGGSHAQELIPGAAPTFRGYVYAANKDTGMMAWKTFTVPEGATGASLWSSVSFEPDNTHVYIGTGNNYTEPATDTSDALVSLDASDGSIVWKNQRYTGDIWSLFNASLGNPDYDFGTNPIVFDAPVQGASTKLVAAGQKSGDIHVLRREKGEEVCKRNLSPGSANGSAGVFNNGAWDGKHLLFAANGATSDAPGSEPKDSNFAPAVLFAIDPGTCDIVWEKQLPGPVMAPITVANGVGFVPADHHMQAFNTDTGEKLYEYIAPSTVASAITIANGYVAFGQGISWSVGDTGTLLTVLKLP